MAQRPYFLPRDLTHWANSSNLQSHADTATLKFDFIQDIMISVKSIGIPPFRQHLTRSMQKMRFMYHTNFLMCLYFNEWATFRLFELFLKKKWQKISLPRKISKTTFHWQRAMTGALRSKGRTGIDRKYHAVSARTWLVDRWSGSIISCVGAWPRDIGTSLWFFSPGFKRYLQKNI